MKTAEATDTIKSVSAPRSGVIASGILLNWVSLVVAALVSFVLTPLMIRDLGQYYYGMWVLIMSITDQYGLLDLGMTAALSRFAGYFQGARDRAGLDELFRVAFFLTLLISCFICGLSGVAAAIAPGFFKIAASDRTTFMRLVFLLGLTTAVAFPERMLAAYLRGIQRFDLFNIASTGSMVVRAVLLIVVLTSRGSIMAVAAVTLGMGIVSFGVHYGMVHLADPSLKLRFTGHGRGRLKELFGFGVYAFIASFGTRLISRVDSIVIGRVLSVGLIAPFNVASRLMDYSTGVFTGVYGPVLSAMSELDGASKQEELRILFIRSSRYTLLLSLLMGVLTLLDGRPFLSLWLGSSGLDLSVTYKVLAILAVCYAVSSAQLPSRTLIYARAKHRLLAGLVLCEGVVNLGLSVYWGPRYGLVGIALGTAVPSVFQNLFVIPYYALRVAKIPSRQYIESLWRPLLAGLLFGLFCFIVPWRPRSIVSLTCSVVYQLFVFGLLTYATALTQPERRHLRMYCRTVSMRFGVCRVWS